jgi:hypothetical protein
MSSVEYRDRVRAAVAADAYAAMQREILSGAQIDDDSTPPEVRRVVMAVLEGRSALLHETDLALLMEYLRGAGPDDETFVARSPVSAIESAAPALPRTSIQSRARPVLKRSPT